VVLGGGGGGGLSWYSEHIMIALKQAVLIIKYVLL